MLHHEVIVYLSEGFNANLTCVFCQMCYQTFMCLYDVERT